ncbi:MAG TPA: type III pantothenate kinase, partial [Verrucomicrobiae bacterium]|nr:type III pantothenate kinase [Verrucomicrobiae bacterium]
MILLLDIGNTHTHLGLANSRKVTRTRDIPTTSWHDGSAQKLIAAFTGSARIEGTCLCSVVPKATEHVRTTLSSLVLELNHTTIRGIGIDYPKPETIGPDRLANAVAAREHFGAPALVVDFGTAVTFDVVNRAGNYVGGIIAPGLSAMTDYLHEKTALLPRIEIEEVRSVIGRSTREAMLIGAVKGYRGLVRELIRELKAELKTRRLPVVATGGYARLIAAGLPEITTVDP